MCELEKNIESFDKKKSEDLLKRKREASKRYKDKNRELVRQKAREFSKNYYWKNLELRREKERTPERKKQKSEWRKENRERINEKFREKYQNDEEFRKKSIKRKVKWEKSNIERAVSKASGGQSLVEVTYEGFGPEGIAVLVETATDNRNRTGQEIKGLFDSGGGQLTGPGAVSFNFEPKGLFVVHKNQNSDDQILSLIDLGAQDVEETEDSLEVYVDPKQLSAIKEKAQDKGFRVRSFELVQNPKTLKTVTGEKEAGKALTFLNNLEEHDDVQKVFATLDVPQETLDKIDAGK